jgi:hypothetical protein
MRKFTHEERSLVKSIVATLSIKRIPESEILKEIERQTNKTITTCFLYYIKEQIRKESSKWYCQLRQGEYEYIHEFKERINEIVDLQRRHYNIIEDNQNNPSIQQASLAELHRLNMTLSNYFDVVPSIGNAPISETPKSISEKRDIINVVLTILWAFLSKMEKNIQYLIMRN